MSVPFYEFRMRDVPRFWGFEILRDASGDPKKGRYGWRDLAWAWRVDVVPPLELAVERTGKPCDVTFVGCNIPVVPPHVADVLRSLAGDEIELIPAKVQGMSGDFFVVNVISEVKCLDEVKTRFVEKWTADSDQPHRAGEYRSVDGLVINPELARGHNIFRIWGSRTEIIASAAVKEEFDREGFTGVNFIDVCSPQPTLAEVAAERKKMRDFYAALLAPVIESYGPVKSILRAIVGFDAGGPVATCVLSEAGQEGMTAYVTCELAAREAQKPGRMGRFELLVVCDDRLWAGKVLTLVGGTSMNTTLDAGHTVDLSPAMKASGPLDAVLLDSFADRRVDGQGYAILRCVGISGRELAFAKQAGTDALRQKLVEAGVYATTKCRRESVV